MNDNPCPRGLTPEEHKTHNMIDRVLPSGRIVCLTVELERQADRDGLFMTRRYPDE